MKKNAPLRALPGVVLAGLKWQTCAMATLGSQAALSACWVIWQAGTMALVYWISGLCCEHLVSLAYNLFHEDSSMNSGVRFVDYLLHFGLIVDLNVGFILASLGIVGFKVGLLSVKRAGQRATQRAQDEFELCRASFDASSEACKIEAGLSQRHATRLPSRRL